MYTAIFESLVAQGNVETALSYLFRMKNQDILPELSAVQSVIILAANCGYSRLAIELSVFYEKTSLRRLDDSVWMACLSSAAQNHYVCFFWSPSYETMKPDPCIFQACWRISVLGARHKGCECCSG